MSSSRFDGREGIELIAISHNDKKICNNLLGATGAERRQPDFDGGAGWG